MKKSKVTTLLLGALMLSAIGNYAFAVDPAIISGTLSDQTTITPVNGSIGTITYIGGAGSATDAGFQIQTNKKNVDYFISANATSDAGAKNALFGATGAGNQQIVLANASSAPTPTAIVNAGSTAGGAGNESYEAIAYTIATANYDSNPMTYLQDGTTNPNYYTFKSVNSTSAKNAYLHLDGTVKNNSYEQDLDSAGTYQASLYLTTAKP